VVETALGWLLLAAGVVMLVTPGPGIVTIVAGLAILARHYRWAERLKRLVMGRIRDARTAVAAHRAERRAGRRAPDDADPDHRHHAA
jgi:uncharacterized protein (TIGR02611 family)